MVWSLNPMIQIVDIQRHLERKYNKYKRDSQLASVFRHAKN